MRSPIRLSFALLPLQVLAAEPVSEAPAGAVREPAAEAPAAEPAEPAAAEPAEPAAEAPAAESAEPAAEVPAAEAAPTSLPDLWRAMDPDALLQEAIEHRSVGDFQGADERFAVLLERGPSPTVLYHAALSLEFQERYERAIALYELVDAKWPDSPEALDARFRRALCLEDLGRHAESLRAVRALERAGDWDDHDRLTLEIERGVAEIRGGHARRGVRRVQRALAELEGTDELTWMRARGRLALAAYLFERAGRIPLRGDRRAARALKRRAHLLSQGERQVTAIAKLGEPEQVLRGLVLLGDAYLALRDDLLAAPPPRRLDAEQARLYREMVAERARTLERKAWAFYDEGVKLAARTRWQGAVVAELRDRRDAIAPAEAAAADPPDASR